MIHYHGTPITPNSELQKMAGRHFCVSFFRGEQVARCHDLGQSVMLDNGAFSAWRGGVTISWGKYYEWAEPWLDYATTWAVIPDVIDGTEEDNDELVLQWPHGDRGAPVWHLHESIDRLRRLCERWPRICFGSSGTYSQPGSDSWHRRISGAFDAIAPTGIPCAWVHMLRGLQFAGSEYPFSSADSSYLARNHHRDGGVLRIANRWDAKQCPPRWHGNTNKELPCID